MSEKSIKIRGAVLETLGAPRPYAESRPLNVQELELDAPGPNEVLVKIAASGVCHSDLSVVNNNRPRPLPMLLGHESAGFVEAVGEGVDDLEIGQQVVFTFLPRCGECRECKTDGQMPCSVGTIYNEEGSLMRGTRRLHRDGEQVHHHVGVSCFATHAVAARESLVPIGNDVPSDIAAVFGCAILTGGGAVLNEIKPGPEDTVAVVGIGGVGMAAIITAVGLGVKKVVGIDMQESKRQTALELGADEVYSPQEAEEQGLVFDGVIEAAGHPKALETAFKVTRAGGITATVGLPAPNSQIVIDPLVVTAQARRLHGSYLGSSVPSKDIPKYEQLWREGKLNAEGLISSHIKLDEINEAMDALSDGTVLRQIITFD
ncbi:Zn-dependent alcohol dehydrogenase, class III [Corynebacterium camporealensis]|uniref:Zn-dependent alcohol dehydrogenase, class III n=1 Tax=Corynebacterium camporealensis TaxID=161896 RepID=A0A0F6QX86_9CORY|nr:Zn-dependent alcohol dehydrogenase, class III [Corynebacterium camporealensis]AVH87835.1 Zn-dependent alcohol dehydrogenase, class III [Corynebacterium camporealensis]